MNVIHQIDNWSSTHNPKWLVYFRVILGVCLCVKGISFLSNSLELQLMIQNSRLSDLDKSLWLAPAITWIHILGGSFIILGLFTRTAIVAQIPIVLGAIIFINSKNEVFSARPDLILSLFVLVLLIVFFIEGGGQVSMDNYVKRHLL